jgi:hypothetical protein
MAKIPDFFLFPRKGFWLKWSRHIPLLLSLGLQLNTLDRINKTTIGEFQKVRAVCFHVGKPTLTE